MELKQKSDEKVRDFYDRVFNVIMYFGHERNLVMAAANQQEGSLSSFFSLGALNQ